MVPRWTSPRTGSLVYESDARTIAADVVAPGSCSLAILDGPYGYGYGAWDRIPRGGTLADLYHGHLDDVGRVCAASASLYLWNTSAGWAELHPLIVAKGWTFRSLIVWHKPDGAAIKSAHEEGARTWPEVMEVCGFYQREAWDVAAARAAVRDAGFSPGDLDRAAGVSCMASRKWLGADVQAQPPGDSDLMLMRQKMPTLGWPWTMSSARPPFACPIGIGNVWAHGQVAGGDRLKTAGGETLHPCQKPLLFAERMIRASSRPGDCVWAPFGGTLRELIAGERIAMLDPTETRRVITCELNQDGKDYIGAALAQIDGSMARPAGQVGLFARTTGDRT